MSQALAHKATVKLIPETRHSLLVRLKNSDDQQAWDEFVRMYQPVVYRVAASRGLQDADALDLVQTVFIAIAGAIENWSPQSPQIRFRHWLLRVAKNATINALTRKPMDRSNAVASSGELFEQLTDTDDCAQSLVKLEYRRELFIQASEIVRVDVTSDSWKAFELTAIQGCSTEVAAQELGKTIGSVYAARSRIMKRLCEAVAQLDRKYQ